jgi:hypothetical protein
MKQDVGFLWHNNQRKEKRSAIYVCHICSPHLKRWCRLSWLTNSALVYEPKCVGIGGGGVGRERGLSQ